MAKKRDDSWMDKVKGGKRTSTYTAKPKKKKKKKSGTEDLSVMTAAKNILKIAGRNK